MPFDGNGNFTVDEPPFTPNTQISSAAVNSNNTDFADGLTNCVTKDGQSTPTAVIPLHVDGVNYAADPDTGLHRTATNTQALKCGGTDVLTASATGVDVTALTVGGFPALIVGEIRPYALTTAPAGWRLCDGSALTGTSPLRTALIAAGNPYGVSGSNPLLPDLRGRQIVGKDDMGGVAANRITAAGGNFNAAVLGGTGGAQNRTVAQANLPNVSFVGTAAAQAITVTTQQLANVAFAGAGGSTVAVSGGTPTSPGIVSATAAASTATVASGGSGTALPAVDPTLITNFIIFVGA